jgi:predicted O-methyltransferase YrrM
MENWFNNIDGFFTYPELYSAMINKYPSGSSFVEIGSYQGKSLAYMIKEVIKSGKAIKITAIDNFVGLDIDIVPDVGLKDRFMRNMLQVCDKFTLISEYQSWDAASLFDDQSHDFVFIDACHEYESVKKDIIAWLPKIRQGGILAGHDYSVAYPGVIHAVHEIFGKKLNEEFLYEACWTINV